MGENSTILGILKESLVEANTIPDWRVSNASPFQRFSSNLRKSFNKLTSLRHVGLYFVN
jgi:hypothetical protein